MVFDAILAYCHFLALFLFAWTLVREFSLLRGGPPLMDITALARTNVKYMIAIVLVFATGLARVFMGIKPAAFYQHNPLFHIKLSLFVLLILLSIQPMRAFVRWRRALAADADFRVAPNEWRRVRLFVLIELHLLVVIPLLADLMARGVGLRG